MAVDNGVTRDLVLPSISSSARAGISALLVTGFRTKLHLKALRAPRPPITLKATPSRSCPARRHSEDAVLGQRGPPTLFRMIVREGDPLSNPWKVHFFKNYS